MRSQRSHDFFQKIYHRHVAAGQSFLLLLHTRATQSTSSSVGAWESLLNPLQVMLFFIFIRIGFSFLRGGVMGGGILSAGQTGLYFNVITFIAAGFVIFFPFRQLAIKALSV